MTVVQRVALVLMIVATVNVPVRYLIGAARPEDHAGYSIVLLIAGAVVLFLPGFRVLLWRVRNRLLFTYSLVGVVPIVLIGILLFYSAKILLGQYAADRVRQAIDDQTNAIASVARTLLVVASRGTDAPALSALLNDVRQQTPGVRAIVRTGDRLLRMPDDGELRDIPSWSEDGFKGLLASDGRYFVGARAGGGETVAVFAYLPLTSDALTALTPGVVSVAVVERGAHVRIDFGKNEVFVRKDGVETPLVSTHALALPAPRGFWDGVVSWLLPVEVRTSSGQRVGAMLALISRPSQLVTRLFTSVGQFGIVIAIVMAAIAFALLLVELGALIWTVRLTRTITGAVHDLYEATRQVAAGNLSHRAPIRAHDQLSELAGSFNNMTDRLARLIADVREKEKLESELNIARRVQIELFPKIVTTLKTLELAGLCVPSRFVSGDYYDVVRLDDRWTALALGDISGKGIAAALVMASVQSALHAQLKFAGPLSALVSNDDAPPIATWIARLSEQIYENTPAEKYATFFCAVYDDERGRLVYTNAGHLPPILVRGGKTIRLDPTGTVIGLLPNVSYDQHVIDLQSGDLLAAYTDGITEAENAAAEQFDAKRLTDLLIQHAHKPLDDIIHIVTDHVRAWAHDPESQDDITILLARKR
jgi:sigma-B regulation protein RsbU (phosphoserine phosphatase)